MDTLHVWHLECLGMDTNAISNRGFTNNRLFESLGVLCRPPIHPLHLGQGPAHLTGSAETTCKGCSKIAPPQSPSQLPGLLPALVRQRTVHMSLENLVPVCKGLTTAVIVSRSHS